MLNVLCVDVIVVCCYLLFSVFGIDVVLKIIVKCVCDGCVLNWLCDCVKVGDVFDVLLLVGVFMLCMFDGDLLLFVGGSGIMFVLLILKLVFVYGCGMLMLIYVNCDECVVIFCDEL